MKRKTVISILVLIVLLVSAIPAFGADGSVRVVVDNKSDSAGKLTLSGPQYYSFDLKIGKNRFNVVSGTYNYTFFGCGSYHYGSFNATQNNAKLALDCEAAAGTETIPFKINNQSGEEFSLTLTGDGYYRFTVKKGANAFEIKKGQYTYSYNACDQDESGKLKMKAKGANLKIKKCKAQAANASTSGMRLKLRNDTGGDSVIYLSGPSSYTFNAPSGRSTVRVDSGPYSFTIMTRCGPINGTINMNKPMILTYWCN